MLATVSGSVAAAAEPDLARDVLPLLKNRCVKCHGPAKQEGGLRLNVPSGIAAGGESGAVVAPGQLEASLMWQRISGDEMPPEDPLPQSEKDLVRAWIAAGATGLPDAGAAENASDHWAFRHLVAPALPDIRDAGRRYTAIDRFVVARMEAAKLALNPEADCRRRGA
jgi:hypothetical protein